MCLSVGFYEPGALGQIEICWGGVAPSDDVGDDLLGANPSGLTTSRCDKSPSLQGVILQLAFFRGITI